MLINNIDDDDVKGESYNNNTLVLNKRLAHAYYFWKIFRTATIIKTLISNFEQEPTKLSILVRSDILV